MILVNDDLVELSCISSMRRFSVIVANLGLIFLNEGPAIGVDLIEEGIGISSLGDASVKVLLSLELFGEMPSTTIESEDVELVDVFWDVLIATAARALVGVLASIGGGTPPIDRLVPCWAVDGLGHSSKLRRNSVICVLSSAIWMALSRMFRDCFFC